MNRRAGITGTITKNLEFLATVPGDVTHSCSDQELLDKRTNDIDAIF